MADDLALRYDDGPHRDLPCLARAPGQRERLAHEPFVQFD